MGCAQESEGEAMSEVKHTLGKTPWDDCKVAFSVSDGTTIWDSVQCGDMSLPDGWELVKTDSAGARVVAVFCVDGVPSMQDGAQVLAEIERLKL